MRRAAVERLGAYQVNRYTRVLEDGKRRRQFSFVISEQPIVKQIMVECVRKHLFPGMTYGKDGIRAWPTVSLLSGRRMG